MTRIDAIILAIAGAILIAIAVLYATGNATWAGFVWIALFAAFGVLLVLRLARPGRRGAVRTAGQSADPANDILLGVTYSGPRTPSPPVQPGIELVDPVLIESSDKFDVLPTDRGDSRPEGAP